MQKRKYYVGLDIGTNSVGYAVTDSEYKLLKHGGEAMWGSHIFDEGKTSAERRSFRTARRRNDRKKQRAVLLYEIFAPEIEKVDPRFFIRRKESALFRTDVDPADRYLIFNDDTYSDREFYQDYPTIHHLIVELMNQKEAHDIRLVYLACAYLVKHRGHFLFEVDKDNVREVTDFHTVYAKLLDTFAEFDIAPWKCEEEKFREVLREKHTVTRKEKDFIVLLNNGKKFKTDEDELVSRAGIIRLLSSGTVELSKLFPKLVFEDKISVSFRMPEEEFLSVLGILDDEADLLAALRNVYDWATLADALKDGDSISKGKVEIYEQHKKDLYFLKKLIRKYLPEKYNDVFRADNIPANYVSYTYHVKETKHPENVKKRAKKEDFCDYIRKLVKDLSVEEEDRANYEDMMLRLTTYQFLPRQVDGDNRVIPYQLYYHELKQILENASVYLPFLIEKDVDGYTAKDKILSLMEFRIPYYVGPLRTDQGKFGWMKRKAEGKIYPWNFEQKVDLDQSEENFIRRMTNTCTYLPGEDVLPKESLLYSTFEVLNEINLIRVNGCELPAEHKQGIFDLFRKYRKVTVKRIREYLEANRLLQKGDVLSGLDESIKSSLKSYHDFKRLLESGTLSKQQAERVIERLTCSEDRSRSIHWLKKEFPNLSDEDVNYLSKRNYQDFGKLSRKFLIEIQGCRKETGEVDTIMGFLWNTSANLMQLLSDSYTFAENLDDIQKEFYNAHPLSVSQLLDQRYVSNSVKRPIYRTLSILQDIRKACGQAPVKIFVEMARGGGEKGKRTKTRRDQIQELYRTMNEEEVRELSEQLEGRTDNELQSEVLFLYFLQLGKCAYTGKPLDIEKLKSNLYNVDHIYPRSYVKDDSLDNKVLVFSEINGAKGDQYPIRKEIRDRMQPYWHMLEKNHLISGEKYRRLIRTTPFTDEEKMGFIQRQLVETRQSTKTVAAVLKTLYPETEIIYSRASLVSDFRHEVLKMSKSRNINDLHHAKDAYLNIVVGNVYHCRFTKKFYLDQKYSLKPVTIFTHPVLDGENVVWKGTESIEPVRRVLSKNNIHYTKFAFTRKGGLFDQNPIKAKQGEDLIPRKAGLDPNKYGGYNKTAAAAFLLISYLEKGKKEAMLLPVENLVSEKVFSNETFAKTYASSAVAKIWGRKEDEIKMLSFPMGLRPLKINTVLSFDGFRACITGKSGGGKQIGVSSLMPLILDAEWENYIKRLDSFTEKKEKNKNLTVNGDYDGISREKNQLLYQALSLKVTDGIYQKAFASQISVLKNGGLKFAELTTEDQIRALLSIVLLLKSGRSGTCDLTLIGGKSKAGVYLISSKISNWKKLYRNVQVADISSSGIYETSSENLLDLVR